jgi:predicted nucleic acid-binding protein
VATDTRTFVDTDVLIDIARKNLRALDFWRQAEARSAMTCSVISVFELLAGCRNLREQRATLRSLATWKSSRLRAEIPVRRYTGIGPTISLEALVSSIALSPRRPGVWIAKFTQSIRNTSELFLA